MIFPEKCIFKPLCIKISSDAFPISAKVKGRAITNGSITWNLIDVLREAASFLEKKGIENPRLNAECLMGHVLDLPRMDLYLQFDRPVRQEERETYKTLLRRRADHEPLQYILGETEFMSLPFKVTPDVFIPRPETEILVETAISEIKCTFGDEKEIQCLDIGTGSGNIAVSIAHYLKNTVICAVDIDDIAIEIARENARCNNVDGSIRFLYCDVTLKDLSSQIKQRFDVIVSNPPYISNAEYNNLPLDVKEYEPKSALDGGEDGLDFYRALCDTLDVLLKKPGIALLEIGETQTQNLIQLFSESFTGEIKVIQDLAGRDRVIVINK